MGCLINYDATHLNILYFYNFPCQSPGPSTLDNLGFSPLSSTIHLSFSHLGPFTQKESRNINV